MKFWHATDEDSARIILKRGLRKGSYLWDNWDLAVDMLAFTPKKVLLRVSISKSWLVTDDGYWPGEGAYGHAWKTIRSIPARLIKRVS